MNVTPKPVLISADEMRKLFEQQVERFSKCRIARERESQNPLHEQFCCTKTNIKYFELETGDEVACVAEINYVNHDKEPVRVILRLRIGDTLYCLRLP